MSGLIPKSKLTAYQRWELAAFDEAEQAAARAAEAAARTGEHSAQVVGEAPIDDSEAVESASLTLPTAAEIERMHIEAHDEGYAEGLAEGKEAGHKEGYDAGFQEGKDAAIASAKKIDALMGSLQQSLNEVDQRLADQLLAASVEIAGQLFQQSLHVKPELLLPVIREAIATINAHAGHPALFAHPDDAALIRTHLGEQLAHNNWRIIDDSTLRRGGCRVELGASEVDATFETRWRRVIESIGIKAEWLGATPWETRSHE